MDSFRLTTVNRTIDRLADRSTSAAARASLDALTCGSLPVVPADRDLDIVSSRQAISAKLFIPFVAALVGTGAMERTEVLTLTAAVDLMRRANRLHVDRHASREGPDALLLARAVLMGDYRMSLAFQRLVELRSEAIMRIFADTAVTMAEADVGFLVARRHGSLRQRSQAAPRSNGGTPLLVALARCLPLVSAVDAHDPRPTSFAVSIGAACRLLEDRVDADAHADLRHRHADCMERLAPLGSQPLAGLLRDALDDAFGEPLDHRVADRPIALSE